MWEVGELNSLVSLSNLSPANNIHKHDTNKKKCPHERFTPIFRFLPILIYSIQQSYKN
jgi:hypothetical protein